MTSRYSFSAGPWCVQSVGSGDDKKSYYVLGADLREIALISPHRAEHEGNGRLISASLEMMEWTILLEAKLLYEIDRHEDSNDMASAQEKRSLHSRVRATLVKAGVL